MARVELAQVQDAPVVAEAAEAEVSTSGEVETKAVLRDGERPLWLWQHRLAPGAALSWDRPRAGIPMPGREPHLLAHEVAERTRAELQRTLDDLKRVLIAAVGRPVRDPRLLDSVTQHLEDKAKGLRDLLEPPG